MRSEHDAADGGAGGFKSGESGRQGVWQWRRERGAQGVQAPPHRWGGQSGGEAVHALPALVFSMGDALWVLRGKQGIGF